MSNNLINHITSEAAVTKMMSDNPILGVKWNSYIYSGIPTALPRAIDYMTADELAMLNWANSKRAEFMARTGSSVM